MLFFLRTLKNKKGFLLNFIFGLLALAFMLMSLFLIFQKHNVNVPYISEYINPLLEELNAYLKVNNLNIKDMMSLIAFALCLLNFGAIFGVKRFQGLNKELSNKSEIRAIKSLRKMEMKYLIKSNKKISKKLNKKDFKLAKKENKKEKKSANKNFLQELKFFKKNTKANLKAM